jgi:Zn-dependent M28 family amino/carboxypeptidase
MKHGSVVLLALVLAAVGAGKWSVRPVMASDQDAERIIDEALKPSALEKNLEQLTDEIGGRLPGTPAMKRAVDWGVRGFKAAGPSNVHTEELTLPNTWTEGATQMTASVDGADFRVRAVSVGWAPALPLSKNVPMVDVGRGTEHDFEKAGDVGGKIVLVHTDVLKTWADLDGEYDRSPRIIDHAVRRDALAIAFIATRQHDILYRHVNAIEGEIDRIPQVEIAREDGERIGRLLAAGHKVTTTLEIAVKVGPPATIANVVAEIKGTEKPDEVVILGAHLDSWDLGTGALDNGCNSALVIDAARAIVASGVKPKRTIRFILFTGEEEGMLGSHAYVNQHAKELDKIAGVVIFDSGIGKVTGFSLGGRKDVVKATEPLVAPLAQFGAATLTTDAESGTDHLDFLLQGVPTFVAYQEEDNYLENYHASSDTLDKVDMGRLKKHVAEAAVLSFALADARERVGPRLHRAEIELTMRVTHLDEGLKSTGIWKEWEGKTRGRVD